MQCARRRGGWARHSRNDRDITLNDELKKLGLRVRVRTATPAGGRGSANDPQTSRERAGPPGKIAFDERGNATYQWNDKNLRREGLEDEYVRHLALHNPRLAIIEEPPANGAPIRSNPTGLRIGYDPYESGLLASRPRQKKRDLRELSRWLEMKRRIEAKSSED